MDTPQSTRTFGKGFTIVELVVVIILLGILAATALPRFIDVGTEARAAVLASLAGNLRTGANLANAQCRLVRGCYESGFSSATITSPDGLSGQMFNGYPTSNANAFASHISRWVRVTDFEINTDSVFFTDFIIADAPAPASCMLRYRFAANFGEEPTVEVASSGC